MRAAISKLLLCAGLAVAKKPPLEFPPDADIVTRIGCHVTQSPDKPGFMPGWYVRVKTVDAHQREWERLLNVFPADKLQEATNECAVYLAAFKRAVKEAQTQRRNKSK